MVALKPKPMPHDMAERYFEFLGTPYQNADGETRQPAKGKFVDLLRVIHAAHRPRFDLNACLAGDGFEGKVYFWSDLHFGHKNIVKFCNRPFSNVEDMNAALLANCLGRVTKDDILVVGGMYPWGHARRLMQSCGRFQPTRSWCSETTTPSTSARS